MTRRPSFSAISRSNASCATASEFNARMNVRCSVDFEAGSWSQPR
jgi:hypothetical protein